MTERWRRIQSVFDEVADRPEAERAGCLAQLTAGDPELRREVESLLLLDQAEATGQFLASPPPLARELRRSMTGEFLEGRSLGQYRLESLLHEGGMGLVFRALDERAGQAVALKLLPPEAAGREEAQRQFEREAAALRELDHPGIVRLLDFGSEGGFRFLVMELVLGRTLREVLAEGPAAFDLVEQLASALAAVHRAGLVHGDIKPENLMVTPEGRLKVVDFGLAVHASPASLRETVNALGLAGTIAYSAPERIRGEGATAASDVFAAGTAIFEMLTGQALFLGKTPWAVAERILQGKPDLTLVEGRIRKVLQACLQQEPARRLADGVALEAVLRESQRERSWWTSTAGKLVLAGAVLAAAIAWSMTRPAPARKELSLGTGVDARLVFSSEGKRVAYSRRNAMNLRQASIFVRDLEGGVERQITSGPFRDRLPSFSRDGSAVFFESDRTPPGIYRQGLDEREPVLAIAGGYAPRVSPDGTRLVYFLHSPGQADPHATRPGIALVATTAGYPRLWLRDDLAPRAPAVWSPDGQTIAVPAAFRMATNASNDLILLLASNGNFTQRFNVLSELCAWTPDAVLLGTTGQASLAGLLADPQLTSSKAATRRLVEHRDLTYCGTTQQGWWAVQSRVRQRFFAARIDPGSELPEGPLTLDESLDGAVNPSISDDDEWLLFASTKPAGDGARHIARHVPTGRQQTVAEIPVPSTGLPKVASSAHVVLTTGSDGHGLLLQLPSLQLIRENIQLETIVWDISRDGHAILSASPMMPRAIREQDPSTGAVSTILVDPKRNLYLADLSSDEHWLVFVAEETGGGLPVLYAAQYRRGRTTPEPEWVRLGRGDYPRWSASGSVVYFLDESLLVPELRAQRVDPVTKRPAGEPITLQALSGEWTPGDLPVGTFRITASRRRIMVTLARGETRLIEGR